LDLLADNHIPDPFIGTNEKDVQWVDSKNWVYTTHFTASPETTGYHSALLFEGLDTFAKVELNDVQICE
jgi:beta-mannosidase